MHAGLSAAFARRHSISRRLNRPISISLSCLCHRVLSLMASSTRPVWLTHIKRFLTAFYILGYTLDGQRTTTCKDVKHASCAAQERLNVCERVAAESPVCTNWLEVGALGLHRAPKALYSVHWGLTRVPWKEPASNSLYDGAPSNGANLFLLSQVQYSPSLLDDKPGIFLSFTQQAYGYL